MKANGLEGQPARLGQRLAGGDASGEFRVGCISENLAGCAPAIPCFLRSFGPPLLRKFFERPSVVITTNLRTSESANVFGATKVTIAMLDGPRGTHKTTTLI